MRRRKTPKLDPVARIERAESFFAATGLSITHGGTMACYAQSSDQIRMPPFETFRDARKLLRNSRA